MHFRSIFELPSLRRIASAVALLGAFGAVSSLRAQQQPAPSAAQKAVERARRPASPMRPIRFLPPVRPIQPPAQPAYRPPVAAAPTVLPRPVNAPAVRPIGVQPIQPIQRIPTSPPLMPRPLGIRPIKLGQPLPMPVPIRPERQLRPQTPTSLLPRPVAGIKYYCTALSVIYNTGSICFDPNLYTIDPAFEPWGRYVIPPLAGPSGKLVYSPFPPAYLIQYCPTCAAQNSGLGLARGLPSRQPPAAIQTKSAPVPVSQGPFILVLKNGTRPVVSRYWLGKDWMLHYITVTGLQVTVPFDQLDLNATGTVNYQRGVVFSIPGWPNP